MGVEGRNNFDCREIRFQFGVYLSEHLFNLQGMLKAAREDTFVVLIMFH